MTRHACLHFALCLLFATAGRADELAEIINSGSASEGVLSVNQAAGSLNQQANLRAISVSSGTAASSVGLLQTGTLAGGSDNSGNPVARIGDNAFSTSHGLIGINQIAGSNNQTVNALALSAGTQTQSAPMLVQDQLLAGTGTGSTTPATSDSPHNGTPQTVIAASAFQGSRGVLQINQIAGSQNRAANLLTVQWVSP